MELPFLGTARDSRLGVVYIDNDLVLSASHAWTYVALPPTPWEFTSDERKLTIASQLTVALAGLVSGQDSVDIHFRVFYRPFDTLAWAQQAAQRATAPAPGFLPYLRQQIDQIDSKQHLNKVVLVGICLGPRASKGGSSASIVDTMLKSVKIGQNKLGLADLEVPAKELDEWRVKAQSIQRALAGDPFRAVPATPEEITWLIQHDLHPELPDPIAPAEPNRPWGRGEIEALAEGLVSNQHKHLRIEQDGGEGFVAYLGFSRFPDTLHFPSQEPWLAYAQSLPFPVEISMRATLVPPRKVKADVARQAQYAKDMAVHMSEAGSRLPMMLQEQLDTAEQLEYAITKKQQPFAYARTRLKITATTLTELLDRVRTTVEHYKYLGIDVVCPSGDQLDLLLEAMPGDRVRLKAYYQRHELEMLGGAMFTASSDIGDHTGLHIGDTRTGLRLPVSFDINYAPTINRPSGIAITGEPGGGKTSSTLLLTYQAALKGTQCVYIDPKADAACLSTIAGMPRTRVLDLRYGDPGVLDPFALDPDPGAAKLLAIETLTLLLGGRALTEERERALLTAIDTVAAQPNPSLGAVLEHLMRAGDDASENLGRVLHTIADLPFARLCFTPATSRVTRLDEPLTIITLLGLPLPAAHADRNDYGYEERLSVALLYLVTRMARQLLLSLDKNSPKAVIIDEAWALTATSQGRKLIPEIARMGRAHNTALVLVSQNASDLTETAVKNCLSTVMSFRSSNDHEIGNVLALLGVPDTPGNRATVRELHNGECLMRDVYERFAMVQVDIGSDELMRAFDTNPLTRARSDHDTPTQAPQPEPAATIEFDKAPAAPWPPAAVTGAPSERHT